MNQENSIKNTVYTIYNPMVETYYNDNGYESYFYEAVFFDNTDEINSFISDNFSDWDEEELDNLEIHKYECILTQTLKRKIVYEPIEE